MFSKAFLQAYRSDLDSQTGINVISLDGGQNVQGSGQAGFEAVGIHRGYRCFKLTCRLSEPRHSIHSRVGIGCPRDIFDCR